jgi:hypothetical protein
MHPDFCAFLPASFPSMDEKQLNTGAVYKMEPVKTIAIPRHYSFDEICGIIRSELGELEDVTAATQDTSIIISSGEFSLIPPPLNHKEFQRRVRRDEHFRRANCFGRQLN